MNEPLIKLIEQCAKKKKQTNPEPLFTAEQIRDKQGSQIRAKQAAQKRQTLCKPLLAVESANKQSTPDQPLKPYI